MTERTLDAITRLTAWLRDYGEGKSSKVFCEDLRIVLETAGKQLESEKEIERLNKLLDHVLSREASH